MPDQTENRSGNGVALPVQRTLLPRPKVGHRQKTEHKVFGQKLGDKNTWKSKIPEKFGKSSPKFPQKPLFEVVWGKFGELFPNFFRYF